MKFLTLFGLLLTATIGYAKPAIDLICVSEIPTTSFIIQQTAEKVAVRVFHHNGSQYAPFWNSLITPNDLTVLTEQGKMVEKLGNDLQFNWNAAGCDAESPMFFQCIGDAENFKVNDMEVHPWALSVTDVEEKTLWGNYKKKNLSLRLSVEDKSYQVTMNYYEGECVPTGDPMAAEKLAKLPIK